MRKIGWLSVLLSALAYIALAVVGYGLGYLYQRHGPIGSGRFRQVFELYVGRSVNPFAGGFIGDVRLTFLIAWVVGLGVGVVVLLVFVLLASRSGSGFGLFTGAWLGTVIGTALAGMVSTIIVISEFMPGDGGIQSLWYLQVFSGLQRGLYWGAVAGWIIGVVAVLGGLGRRRSTRPDVVPPPDSSWQPER